MKPIDDIKLRETTEQLEQAKASISSAVERPFRVIERQFGHVKVRYKGPGKTLPALSNLTMARNDLLVSVR